MEDPHNIGDPEDQEDESQKEYVVITEDMEKGDMYTCVICLERFQMSFNQQEEEWIFDDCKENNGVVYHFPLCYQAGLEGLQKNS